MLKISLLALDYPCPLFSSRSRSAVYGEVGHTIMNLLAVCRWLIYLERILNNHNYYCDLISF